MVRRETFNIVAMGFNSRIDHSTDIGLRRCVVQGNGHDLQHTVLVYEIGRARQIGHSLHLQNGIAYRISPLPVAHDAVRRTCLLADDSSA